MSDNKKSAGGVAAPSAEENKKNISISIIEQAKEKIVYIIMHDETDDYGNTKLKMLGKLLEQKVCVEGMVTICLRCITDEKGHHFVTNSDGNDISKSPEEMFDKLIIDNDLKYVDTVIREYYRI